MRLPVTTFALLVLALLAWGCASPGKHHEYEDYPVSFPEMVRHLERDDPHLSTFEKLGPFPTRIKENVAITLKSGERLLVDVLGPTNDLEAPVAMIVHGNFSQKEAHRFQALRLASFGLYVVVAQVPIRDRWIENGRTIKQLVDALVARPKLVHPRADLANLVLAGHSFGASAITVAAANGAPVRGLVLLDPAVYAPEVMKAMRAVKQPVMILGADKEIFRSRKRPFFYRHLSGEVAEISITGATHDDAQHPSMFAMSAFGIDPYTNPERQGLFAAALTASVLSLSSTGQLDLAWNSFQDAIEHGDLKEPQRRGAISRAAPESPRRKRSPAR